MCLQTVYGEIYYVDDKFLARLDFFEGYPHLYQRDVITINTLSHAEHEGNRTLSSAAEEKKTVKCSTYLLKHFDQALLDKETFSSYDSSDAHGRPYRAE